MVVVVRAVDTDKHDTYVAVVNTAWTQRQRVQVKLPGSGPVTALATGQSLPRNGGSIPLDLRPYQWLALRVTSP